MTLGPPWFSTTQANVDLFLGLGVTTAAQIDAECDSGKTGDDLEE